MYIRRTTHADKKNKKEYHTFKLIESVRTERGPRQRMLLNLGTDFSLPEDRWKDLANRIEEIITGQDALFAYPADIENLAVRYARKVIDYQGEPGGGGIKSTDPDYHRVYKTSDLLLRHKKQIEDHLCAKECSLFNLEEKIILYDLTNTFFEGSGRYNGKAHFGPSKEKRSDCPLVTLETEMITVREDNRRLIRAAIIKGPDDDEVTLYCHSTDKEIKERGIKNLFESRFEEKLEQIRNALSKKHGTKVYEKVVEKIGRLKERYKRISSRYEIAVTKDENTNRATTIAWERKEQEKPAGVYCLRSNRIDFKEQELFNIFAMLTDIEDAFRSMKSELGMRPVYHQNENRTDGHLFITVLAYHILHSIRVHLRSQGVNDCWTTVRKRLSTHVRITTTMKRDDGKSIHIRKSTRPEAYHKIIYDALQLSPHPGITIKTIL